MAAVRLQVRRATLIKLELRAVYYLVRASVQTVRLEGTAGLMRTTGLPEGWPTHCGSTGGNWSNQPIGGNCGPIGDGRFSDILIDVSNSYGPASPGR